MDHTGVSHLGKSLGRPENSVPPPNYQQDWWSWSRVQLFLKVNHLTLFKFLEEDKNILNQLLYCLVITSELILGVLRPDLIHHSEGSHWGSSGGVCVFPFLCSEYSYNGHKGKLQKQHYYILISWSIVL